jgi:hypothetical protein
VTKEPQIFENLQLGKENVTGVGAQLGITFTDSSGKPLAGASVTEKNSPAGLENPGAVTTNSKGTINDYVLKAGPSASMPPGGVAGLKDFVTTNPITVKTTQTLTITAGKQSYQATYTRTLTNVGANGKLNTNFNSHGVNFTISFTKPVITTSQ